jgi:hypothetical protein
MNNHLQRIANELGNQSRLAAWVYGRPAAVGLTWQRETGRSAGARVWMGCSMAFIDGCVAVVPAENRYAYIAHARKVWPIFAKYGAVAMRECWGEDAADGQITALSRAVGL